MVMVMVHAHSVSFILIDGMVVSLDTIVPFVITLKVTKNVINFSGRLTDVKLEKLESVQLYKQKVKENRKDSSVAKDLKVDRKVLVRRNCLEGNPIG